LQKKPPPKISSGLWCVTAAWRGCDGCGNDSERLSDESVAAAAENGKSR